MNLRQSLDNLLPEVIQKAEVSVPVFLWGKPFVVGIQKVFNYFGIIGYRILVNVLCRVIREGYAAIGLQHTVLPHVCGGGVGRNIDLGIVIRFSGLIGVGKREYRLLIRVGTDGL